MMKDYILTSEAVSEGHPDKVCDQISDAILDAYISRDPAAHVACETLVTTNRIVLAGEISSNAPVDKQMREEIARSVVRDIGYTRDNEGFNFKDAALSDYIHTQSPDIAQGVNQLDDVGAGDQGLMFGFACKETEQFMPAPIFYAQRVMERFAQLRHGEPDKFGFLRPDAKTQLCFRYEDGKPAKIEKFVLSHQHTEGMQRETLLALTKQIAQEVIPTAYLPTDDEAYIINGTGNFVIGGPNGDAGVTGRKIIVDTYGGMARHGGGAFSGKDPTKVDRSAAYMARYAAKNLVAAGICDVCEIQVSYAIGKIVPLSFLVDMKGTGKVPESKIIELFRSRSVFDFRPAQIAKALSLTTPQGWTYRETACYGHFGRPQFPWEKLDKVEELRRILL